MSGISANFNVDFSANPQILNTPQYFVQFTNLTPNPLNYEFTWDFGDGNVRQDNNLLITHEYLFDGQYDVALLAIDTCFNNCCQESNIKLAYITCSSTLSDSFTNKPSEISLFPNPAINNIQISIEDYHGPVKSELYDMAGNKVSDFCTTFISLEKYAKGLYMLKVSYGEITKAFRVMKD